ncbi:hypothetical protein HN51_027639 [Arachis hypogaea]
MTVVFFVLAYETSFFPARRSSFRFPTILSFSQENDTIAKLFCCRTIFSAVYLQVSTISQALIFVTRSRGWSYTQGHGLLLLVAFVIAQLVLHVFFHLIVIYTTKKRISTNIISPIYCQ